MPASFTTMTTTRLTFLYPHLFRTLRLAENPTAASRQCRRPKARHATFMATSRKAQQFAPRHGKGVEPIAQPGDTKDSTTVTGPETSVKSESKVIDRIAKERPEPDLSSAGPLSEETQQAARIPGDIGSSWLSPEQKEEKLRAEMAANTSGKSSATFDGHPPADTVLHMAPPAEPPTDNTDPPHLIPPPYIHHFDSYTLTKSIEAGGFTPSQSIEAMKILRALLSTNLEVAQHGLVSKSDVENETYLFQAACSELRTEIQNARKANDEEMRMRRTLLQHEVDILSQKLTQDLATLKDDLRGMFNDRKMEVRMEQRSMESAIQELNYKITVALNSDSKSEVEGVRWIITRRAALAIVFMAIVVLSSLRLASYRSHEAKLAQQRAEKEAEAEKQRVREGKTQVEDAIIAAEGLLTS